MTDLPWAGDACSLVAALRAKELSPTEALDGSLAAIRASSLNAVSFVDEKAAYRTAAASDVTLPFGGVPMGIKELVSVLGWPATEASLVLADQVSPVDSTMVRRLRAAGAVLCAQTTSSEFGGINCTSTRLHGTTTNPWDQTRTPGGSSGGSAAAVAGGLLPIASGSDGGGSIRIPAGFSGLLGLKATFGRIPKGPHTEIEPLTAVLGCVARSVADTARWFDACNGNDEYDPFSLPGVGGWEAGLGSFDLSGLRAVIVPDLGSAIVAGPVAALVEVAGTALLAACGGRRIDVAVSVPQGGREWMMAGTASLLAGLGDRYPDCVPDLTPEIVLGANITTRHFDAKAAINIELYRRKAIVAMAELFERVDVIICASNPDVAFAAAGPMSTTVGGVDLMAEYGFDRAISNNGALTIPANTTGNPAISIPVGCVDGLPVGMQVIGRHHAEPLLLDLALAVEHERPWPLVAPGAPL